MLAFGALLLVAALLPRITRRTALSTPLITLAIGALAFALGLAPENLVFRAGGTVLQPMLEAVLLISLMGAGLSIDRPVGMRSWSATWRLLGAGMPLMAVCTVAAGIWILGLALPEAILLAAIVTPTDPVLAKGVGVKSPGAGGQDEVRFGLTSEAGLNDGLAFPIAIIGLQLANDGNVGIEDVARLVLWGTVISIACGWAVGRTVGLVVFRSRWWKASDLGSGLIAVGTTMIAYGLAELMHGYGFIAVFVAALNLRNTCSSADFNVSMDHFSSQLEQLLVLAILLLFGGFLTSGVLANASWGEIAMALLLIFILRPLTALASLTGLAIPFRLRALTAFFGIRGMGTLYYVVFVGNHAHLAHMSEIRIVAMLTVLGSILVHGASSTPLMRRFDP